MKHFVALDGLRGLAIVLVMLFHFELIGFGWVGVQMFFVLSGFLITGILLADKQQATSPSALLKRFYWRRVLRIFPLYFLYLILLIGLDFFIRVPGLWKFIPFLATYSFNFTPLLQAYKSGSEFFGHLWSLAIEEQFYLVWPFLIAFFSIRKIKTTLIVILFLAPFIRFFAAPFLQNLGLDFGKIMYWATPAQMDSLATGACVAVWGWHNKNVKVGVLLIIAVGVLAITGLWNQWHYPTSLGTLGFTAHVHDGWQHVYNYSVINIATALLVVVLICGKSNFITRVFSLPWLVQVGKISYGMYIFHEIINLFFLDKILPLLHMQSKAEKLVLFPIYFVVVFFVSWLSFRYFESWFLSKKDRYFNIIKN